MADIDVLSGNLVRLFEQRIGQLLSVTFVEMKIPEITELPKDGRPFFFQAHNSKRTYYYKCPKLLSFFVKSKELLSVRFSYDTITRHLTPLYGLPAKPTHRLRLSYFATHGRQTSNEQFQIAQNHISDLDKGFRHSAGPMS
jgi:hypothetical protein